MITVRYNTPGGALKEYLIEESDLLKDVLAIRTKRRETRYFNPYNELVAQVWKSDQFGKTEWHYWIDENIKSF